MTVAKPVCIDLYHLNPVSDLAQAQASGIVFLAHKASEGQNPPDQEYAARRKIWLSGAAVTIVDVDGTQLALKPRWGAYHFFHGQDPVAEAKHFLAAAALDPAANAFVDWENVGASGYQPSASAVDMFCQEVENALGQSCDVYTGNVGREQFDAHGVASALVDRFTARKLWFCSYGAVIARLPLPWQKTGAWLWQDDGDKFGPGPHTIPGIKGYCDNSTVVSPMTVARLYQEWGGVAMAA
jgi:lysozyme